MTKAPIITRYSSLIQDYSISNLFSQQEYSIIASDWLEAATSQTEAITQNKDCVYQKKVQKY